MGELAAGSSPGLVRSPAAALVRAVREQAELYVELLAVRRWVRIHAALLWLQRAGAASVIASCILALSGRPTLAPAVWIGIGLQMSGLVTGLVAGSLARRAAARVDRRVIVVVAAVQAGLVAEPSPDVEVTESLVRMAAHYGPIAEEALRRLGRVSRRR